MSVEVVDWGAAEADIRAVRHAVFTVEQGIASSLDFDGRDALCTHVLARDRGGRAIGTARMLSDGHLGRIAVVGTARGRGIGTALTRRLLDVAARNGLAHAHLHAQAAAVGFYERLGFRPEGAPFIEAGIEHRRMVRPFAATTPASA